MTEIEKKLLINAEIMSAKMKALKGTLDNEQLKTYKKILAIEAPLVQFRLEQFLEIEELRKAMRNLHE